MGYDAACTLRYEGKTSRGTARLEHKDLVFRGPVRLAVPLNEISAATADDGVLVVRFGDRTAEFEIGAAAAKWAARIMNPPSRLDKLGLKPDMSLLVVSLEDPTFVDEAKARGARIVRKAPAGGVDAIFFGAQKRADLQQIGELKKALKPNGALWIVRPKGIPAITEAETMAAGKRAGLVDVKVVSFSETNTAEKFVVPVAKRPR
jgi:hypothetical protein